MDTVDNAITKPVHRLEVFTGAGRRRTFTVEDKARIVAEIAASGDSVSGVAHGLSPQQLFGWNLLFLVSAELRRARRSLVPERSRWRLTGSRFGSAAALTPRPSERCCVR